MAPAAGTGGRRSPSNSGSSKSSKKGTGSDSDTPKEIRTSEQSEDFMMNVYKLKMCPRSSSHDWRTCPYAHQGENAARRDHQTIQYLSVCCPESKAKRVCPRGNDCPFAHSMTEYFLHPSRYRTQMCNDGAKCTRPICFFAHSTAELRTPAYPSLNPTQLEALFSARASLAREDEAQLEQTLRACVIGPLPPLPSCADAPSGASAPGTSTAAAAPAPLPARKVASTGAFGGATTAAGALAFDAQAQTAALAGGSMNGLLKYHPVMGNTAGGAFAGLGGAVSLLGADAVSAAMPLWAGQLPAMAKGLFAPDQQAPYAAAIAHAQAPMWLQQPAATAASARDSQHQHQQTLANLYQIQKLRDQLKVAEDAEIAQLVHAEAAAAAAATYGMNPSAAAAGMGAMGPGSGPLPRLSGSALFGGAGSASGMDLEGYSRSGPLPQVQQAFPDVPPGLPNLITHQAAAAAAAQSAALQGSSCLSMAFADLGGADLGHGAMRTIPAVWGSGAMNPDLSLLSTATMSAPLMRSQPCTPPAAVAHQRSWPPAPAFGGEGAGAGSAGSAPHALMRGISNGAESLDSIGTNTSAAWSFPSTSGLSSLSGLASVSGVASILSSAGSGARYSDPGNLGTPLSVLRATGQLGAAGGKLGGSSLAGSLGGSLTGSPQRSQQQQAPLPLAQHLLQRMPSPASSEASACGGRGGMMEGANGINGAGPGFVQMGAGGKGHSQMGSVGDDSLQEALLAADGGMRLMVIGD